MDTSLFLFRGGVRSLGKKKLADGNEHELFFQARTPAEVAAYWGSSANLDKMDDKKKRAIAYDEHRAKYIAACLCDESGELLFTSEIAKSIPLTLKVELCDLINTKSDEISDDTGKD